jgi:hypothetical protein
VLAVRAISNESVPSAAALATGAVATLSRPAESAATATVATRFENVFIDMISFH